MGRELIPKKQKEAQPLLIIYQLLVPLGWFWVPFARQLHFEGGPQIVFLEIEANKMRRNGVLDRVLKKHEFQWIFDAKVQGPDLVKNEFGRWPVAI